MTRSSGCSCNRRGAPSKMPESTRARWPEPRPESSSESCPASGPACSFSTSPGSTAFRGTGSGYFMTANRISYHLGLTGPSVAIDSACSSSLTAVHQGCAALRSGEADTVIAAGVNLILTPALSIFYTQAGLSAPDGRCKPFGRDADGIGRGEGVAAVVLRRLDDAHCRRAADLCRREELGHQPRRPQQRDHRPEPPVAGGADAPGAEPRRGRRRTDRLRRSARHRHGARRHDRSQRAWRRAQGTRRRRPVCSARSKGNIGHTEGSAGIAAFIKTCLALHRRVLPPTVIGDGANPALRLAENGLQLADGPRSVAGERRAGRGQLVRPRRRQRARHPGDLRRPRRCPTRVRSGVLTISAPSAQALRRNAESMAAALRDPRHRPGGRLVPLDQRRQAIASAPPCASKATATPWSTGLQQFAAGARRRPRVVRPARRAPAGVGLLFSGQGTQYPGMTRPLYDANPDLPRRI